MDQNVTPDVSNKKKIIYWNLGICLLYTVNLVVLQGDSIGKQFGLMYEFFILIIHSLLLLMIGFANSVSVTIKKSQSKDYEKYYIASSLVFAVGIVISVIAAST